MCSIGAIINRMRRYCFGSAQKAGWIGAFKLLRRRVVGVDVCGFFERLPALGLVAGRYGAVAACKTISWSDIADLAVKSDLAVMIYECFGNALGIIESQRGFGSDSLFF
jgi:hypothetical protein